MPNPLPSLHVPQLASGAGSVNATGRPAGVSTLELSPKHSKQPVLDLRKSNRPAAFRRPHPISLLSSSSIPSSTTAHGRSRVGSASSDLSLSSKAAHLGPPSQISATPQSAVSHHVNSALNRSRSILLTLLKNLTHPVNSQYVVQEKAYLRKIRNQHEDDYYTKGISGAENDASRESDTFEDDDEDEAHLDSGDFLADMDDEKYQIDFSLAISMMQNSRQGDSRNNLSNSNNNSNASNKNLNTLNVENSDDPTVMERLEWQSMLASVLTGDVIRSEKTRIITNNPDNLDSILHSNYRENLWFEIRARIFGRTEDDQRKTIFFRRTIVEKMIDDVMKFEVAYDDISHNPPRAQVADLLDRYDQSCSLWPTVDMLRNDHPICASEEFVKRIDALTAWLTITDGIDMQTDAFRVWIGNDDLDITRAVETPAESAESAESAEPENSDPSSSSSLVLPESPSGAQKLEQLFDEDKKSLAERLMKEKDVHNVFSKRIFQSIAPWMIKSKANYIFLGQYFEMMKLPDYIYKLIQICIIPVKLIKEIINIRLGYALKLQNPTLMMIDQMIDDFKTYITIALEVKLGIQEYCKPDEARTWILGDLFEREYLDFDQVVLRCVKHFLVLLNRKLLDSSRSPTTFRTFKEPEELEEAWNYLKWLGNFIDGGSVLVAEQVTALTLKLIHRLLAYYTNQTRHPQVNSLGGGDLVRWYTSTTENFGQMRRKLARFTSEISRDFNNALIFNIPSSPSTQTKKLLEAIKSSNHFLVYTGTVEAQGTYFFASPELMGNEQDILRIINGSFIGYDSHDANLEFSKLLNMILPKGALEMTDMTELVSTGEVDSSYVVAICPPKPIVWDGPVIQLNMSSVPITDLKLGQMMLISRLPHYSLHIVKRRFMDIVSEALTVGESVKAIEHRCSLPKVYQDLNKINRAFFKMSLVVLDLVSVIRDNCKQNIPEGGWHALVYGCFAYAKDYGKNTLRGVDSTRKSAIIMKLMQLSIQWVSFICDDCIPTDRRTFRWCVTALEFAMDMTRGFNVLVLKEEQFYNLKLMVARCMSLLISHFDIMGARSNEAEKKKLLKWTSQHHKIENSADEEYILKVYREDTMKQIGEIEEYRRELQEELLSVGRVLDVTDLEYQFVTLLASSFSSLSIRWQKGLFIGSGTFGQVSSAVNLDTGGVMAVKEIRFHDSQSIKNIVPSIKDEMTVLEMLNHPNIVQYFGVEVHRDKVYIFMEYCEGGSLSGLLTHGRIEDEMVIQVYTLQMLEGLAYLHQSGVVHRDIKPENILLDHNGVIKFVDFGAAKVIATTGRTRSGALTSSNPQGMEKHLNLNSMTGTPMYMSPEVITGANTDRSGVVDIWSLGCCVLEMATGRRPWSNLDNEWAIMYHIAAGNKPQLPSSDQLSEGGRAFISRCLDHDFKKRPTALELLNDPWIVEIRQLAFGTSDSVSTPSSETGMELPGPA